MVVAMNGHLTNGGKDKMVKQCCIMEVQVG